jgi:hypothetical protein
VSPNERIDELKMKMMNHWRERLGIEVGMSREEALGNFREWRETKKTCQRCGGDKYVDYCPIHLVCQESELEEEVIADESAGREIDSGSRTYENIGIAQAGLGSTPENQEIPFRQI